MSSAIAQNIPARNKKVKETPVALKQGENIPTLLTDRKIVNLLIGAKILTTKCLMRIIFRSPAMDGGLTMVKLFFQKNFMSGDYEGDLDPVILIVPTYSHGSWIYEGNSLVTFETIISTLMEKFESDETIEASLKKIFLSWIPKIKCRYNIDEYIIYVLDLGTTAIPVPFTGGNFQFFPASSFRTVIDLNVITLQMKQFQTQLLKYGYICIPGFSTYDFIWDGGKFVFIGITKLVKFLNQTINISLMTSRPFQDRMFTSKWALSNAQTHRKLAYIHPNINIPSYMIESYSHIDPTSVSNISMLSSSLPNESNPDDVPKPESSEQQSSNANTTLRQSRFSPYNPRSKPESTHQLHFKEVLNHTKGRGMFKDLIVKGKESSSVYIPRTLIISQDTYENEESIYITQHISSLFASIHSTILYPLNTFNETNYKSKIYKCPACFKSGQYLLHKCCIPRVKTDTEIGLKIHSLICIQIVCALQNLFNGKSTPEETTNEIYVEMGTLWDLISNTYIKTFKPDLFIHDIISTIAVTSAMKEGPTFV